MSSCSDCNSAATMAETIQFACKQLVNGHAGVAAMYDVLAENSQGEVQKIFKESAEKHRRIARETAENITLPEEGDVAA